MKLRRFSAALLAFTLLAAVGCAGPVKEEPKPAAPAAPAAPARPYNFDKDTLVVGFVPSQDAAGIETKVQPMADYLSKELGLPVKVFVGTNFVALIEAMGSKQADVGFLNPMGYVMAKSDYDVQLVLKSVRRGLDYYKAQLTTRVEDNIPACDMNADPKCTATFNALKGKKIAFVDPASTSGYVFPASFMKGAGVGIKSGEWFSEVTFAGAHDSALRGVYTKAVDASWTFDGIEKQDNTLKVMPEADKRLKAVAFTPNIPNDTLSVRKGLSPELVKKIQESMMKYVKSDEGKAVLKNLYTVDDFTDKGTDADYNVIRDLAKNLGIDFKAELSKKK